MNHFFVQEENINEEGIRIDDPRDVNHIGHVLRMRPGEMVSISVEGRDREYVCRIDSISDDRVHTRIEDINDLSRELPVEITLYQGLPKGDKMEMVIQKAVELGAVRIVPVSTKRTVVKLDAKRAAKKTARWNEIAKSAAKQSKRRIIPQVSDVMSYGDAVSDGQKLDMLLIPYEEAEGMAKAREAVSQVRGKKSLGIYIGPEGGFEPSEVELAQKAGARAITLGHRILRTETAGMMLLSVIGFALEE